VLADTSQNTTEVIADLVIGADGVHSRIARLVEADVTHAAQHAACSIYGYFTGLQDDGNHWYFGVGQSVGMIPTNDAATCLSSAP
jgi:2-polyprenyl-6-methoxyphenol hydroxylase-like FAD-dependent oxidoreductase